MPAVGPSEKEIAEAVAASDNPGIQIVDVDDRVARQLASQERRKQFSESFGQRGETSFNIGYGDTIEVNIWEAPPATLFGGGLIDARATASVRPTALPEQMVDIDGFIMVPFAGRIKAAGLSPQAVASTIEARLKGKANQPEVLVRVLRNASSTVTVVGDVTNSLRMPLTAGGERLLDALAAAGGVRQAVSKMTVQVTRGNQYEAMPLDVVIRDPRQNIPLHPGDVITAMFQPLSFTALGATGKNEEISFEAQGISLAQALARVGGLDDSRSNPQGVFIFRFEPEQALPWPRQPVKTTADGMVPVVYRIDLRNPSSFFVMQGFPIKSKDVLYVANAPAAELQKFLNLVFSVAYPVLNAIPVLK
jgi:polysaccharide export outer membrane protein